MTPEEIRVGAERLAPWFYDFDLGHGVRTRSRLPPQVAPIHETRRRMISTAVQQHFRGGLDSVRCLDVGCHEGYYSVAMARLGLGCVVGIEPREESLERARFVKAALELDQVSLRRGRVEELDVAPGEHFDLTLCLGLLYHLENPMLALRQVAAATTGLCVVETQVIPEVEGTAEWGAAEWTRPYRGVLALIDETPEHDSGNAETGMSPIATCPTPRALEFMLRSAGFRDVETISAPADAYEQHARGQRVVCVARK